MYELRNLKLQQNHKTVMHLHVFKRKEIKFLIVSESANWDWEKFLEQAVISSHVRRFVEISCDGFGTERVLRDFSR